MGKEEFFKEVIEWIKSEKPIKTELDKKKRFFAKKHKVGIIITDVEIYLNAPKEDAPILRPYLQIKPVRTGSGVAVVASMTEPLNCPHGSCIYCPGGVGSPFGDVPKSYTGNEPSTMRSIRNEYDPYRIVFNRLEHYIAIGQNPEKVDHIIQGGTFTSYPKKYQKEYVYYLFKAFNDFSKLFYVDGKLDLEKFKEFFELPGPVADPLRAAHIKEKLLELKNKNLRSFEDERDANEDSDIKCIGLTIETKPDWGFKEHGLEMLKLGATRVELGIQSVYDEVLRKVNRGYGIEETKRSISELRDLGFKLNFHMMPGLPDKDGKRISRERDIKAFKTLFEDDDFKPDMLKIYPCMVMPGTALEKEAEKGMYRPLTTSEAAEIIVKSKEFVPEYCRIMRVQRDIPSTVVRDGVDKTNLRQYVAKLAEEENVKCRCIRCREVRNEAVDDPEVIVREYEASNGKEFFISMEAQDKILGFVRLRLPPRSLHPAITLKSALIRELHVYGSAIGVKEKQGENVQHGGVGKQLMAKAEEIAKANEKDKIVVISGVGVRGYYKKLGYKLEGPYMVKKI